MKTVILTRTDRENGRSEVIEMPYTLDGRIFSLDICDTAMFDCERAPLHLLGWTFEMNGFNYNMALSEIKRILKIYLQQKRLSATERFLDPYGRTKET